MKRIGLRAVLLAALLMPLATLAQAPTEEQLKQVVARVGDEEITAGDFAREMQFRIREIQSRTGQNVNPDVRFRRALMAEMINGKILGMAARNAGVTVPEEDVEAEFVKRKDVFKSEEAYQQYLKRVNMTEETLKENLRFRLRVDRFVDQKVGELTATDAEIEAEYEKLKAQGAMTRTEKTRDIGVILLRPKGDSDEEWREAEERAKAVHARLVAGEDFAVLAREVSEDTESATRGGAVKEMRVGSFYPELETAMSSMAKGDYSAPLRSPVGWYLVTIQGENEPGTIPLETVREGVQKQVIDNKRNEKIAAIVEDAQKLIRVELVDAPVPAPSAPAGDPGSPQDAPAPVPAPEAIPPGVQ